MIRPVAVLVADIHYNLQTLPLADAALQMAINTSNELQVPLIVAGDLHDTKANMRGECMNAMLVTFSTTRLDGLVYILRGNHDSINEKSKEHSLTFLEYFVCYDDNFISGSRTIVDEPTFTSDVAVNGMSVHLVPYHYDVDELKNYLNKIDKGSCVIMHQGIIGSNAGDYIQDKSALTPQDVAGLRVISGHYHTRQTIDLPGGGKWDYIGNPYTLTYGEANDPPKGFQVLMSDGSLEFVPTNLRKHVVFEGTLAGLEYDMPGLNVDEKDLAWVKLKDKRENLMLTREQIAKKLKFITPFRLDLIPRGTNQVHKSKSLTEGPLLDDIITNLTNTSEDCKIRLKELWKNLCQRGT